MRRGPRPGPQTAAALPHALMWAALAACPPEARGDLQDRVHLGRREVIMGGHRVVVGMVKRAGRYLVLVAGLEGTHSSFSSGADPYSPPSYWVFLPPPQRKGTMEHVGSPPRAIISRRALPLVARRGRRRLHALRPQLPDRRRRHHCRVCGQIFCDACTQGRRRVPDILRDRLPEGGGDVDDPVRVCDTCAAHLDRCADRWVEIVRLNPFLDARDWRTSRWRAGCRGGRAGSSPPRGAASSTPCRGARSPPATSSCCGAT